jgi:hypothetical protein
MACIASIISSTDIPDTTETDRNNAKVATSPLPLTEKSWGVNGTPGPVIALNRRQTPPKKPIVLDKESFFQSIHGLQ